MKRLLLGGHGGRSGVPRYVCDLAAVFNRDETVVVSDTNLGGYDSVAEASQMYYEVIGLASQNLLHVIPAYRRLNEIMNEQKPDVVWANSSVSILLIRLWLFFNNDPVRLITVYHGLPFGRGRGALRSVVMFLIECLACRLVSNELCVFISQKDMKASFFLPKSKKKKLVNNCASQSFENLTLTNERQLPHENVIICMTTRVSKQKNLTAALEILRQLPPNYHLWLVGEGTHPTDKFYVDYISNDAYLNERVKGFGSVEDVRPYLCEADLYLMTSAYEGFALGALEAFSVGLPIVITDVGGREELAAAMGKMLKQIDVSDITQCATSIKNLVQDLQQNQNARSQIINLYRENFAHQIWVENINNVEKSR